MPGGRGLGGEGGGLCVELPLARAGEDGEGVLGAGSQRGDAVHHPAHVAPHHLLRLVAARAGARAETHSVAADALAVVPRDLSNTALTAGFTYTKAQYSSMQILVQMFISFSTHSFSAFLPVNEQKLLIFA